MSVSTIYATYSGHWDNFAGGGDTFASIFNVSGRGGSNGGIGGIKLEHYEYGDRFREAGIGFVQFDTSSIPANAIITSALFNVDYTRNNTAFGGIGMAISNMAVGWRYDEGVDEWNSGNVLDGDLHPSSGIVNFNIANPNTNITKAGWSKYHVGTSNVMSRVSPGIAAGVGADDFNMVGYNDGTVAKRPKLIITWTTAPAVTTGASSSIEETTAVLAGTVTDYGGGTVSNRGVCWATGANPTTANANATTGSDAISVSATGLSKNTLYHYRAFIITENSTQYGSDQTFTTDTDPSVITGAVTLLQPISATLGGNITSNGSGVVSTAGVCWTTTADPTTASPKTATATILGAFTVSTGQVLLPGTLYHYRAYVTTAVSTQYGADTTLRTPGGAILFNLL